MTPTRHSTTSADGTEIAWYDFGGTGPDLVLGHATGFCGPMWAPVVERVDGFRCVAYDVRGHGSSARPDYGIEGWDWSHFAEDLAAVIDDAGLDRPFGVGHSSGGATQLLLEERRPGSFAGLYLFEPVIFAADPPAGPDPDRELAVRTRRRRRSFTSRAEALESFAAKGPFSMLDRRALESYLDHGFETADDGTVTLRLDPDDEADIYVMASAHDGFAHLGRVSCPVTVARGETSTAFAEDEMRLVASRLPHGRFAEFPGAGHFGPLEQPEAFARAVTEMFGGLR